MRAWITCRRRPTTTTCASTTPASANFISLAYAQLSACLVEIYAADTDSGARVLRSGTDISLLASGIKVAEALEAAETLQAQGISAEVVDVFRIKPLDSEVILDSVRRTGAVVTAENHNVINGLGSAVAELLAEHHPAPQCRVGVRESFGQVGTTDWLMGDYGLTAASIVAAAEGVLARK